MVANKMTGRRALFTAAYVTKFEEMEKRLTPAINSKLLYQIAQALEEKEKQIALLTPAAEFGNAVSNNAGGILIRDYVKVLENDDTDRPGQIIQLAASEQVHLPPGRL